MFGLKNIYSLLSRAFLPAVTGRRKLAALPFGYKAKPEEPRQWHDLEQPAQRRALEAAKGKRERRCRKLYAWATWSADLNRAHYDEFDNLHDRLNPFYVAK